jgi:ribonuclease D
MTEATGESIIQSPEELKRLVEHLERSGRFAFDTEFVSEETFEPVLCLIQIATRERLAVIDALAVGDLSSFWEVALSDSVEVVMHAAGEDLRICQLRTGRLPLRMFDVQMAAGLIGLSYPLSLSNLVAQILGIRLAGSETRTDWRRRPLSPAQLEYALDDVRHLLDLFDRISARLDELGRGDWARTEFADFLRSVAERAEIDRWRRLPGLQALSRRGLEAARLLAIWREDEARRMNRPLRQVMRDDLLTAIAKRQPRNRRELEALRDFNRPALLHRSPQILDVLELARRAPEAELPELTSRWEEPAGLSTVTNLLSATLAQCCAQNELAVGLVGNVGDLKQLVRWHLEGQVEPHRPALMRGWREPLFGRMLLDVLEGRLGLRVVDPASEFPVAVEPVGPRKYISD